MRMYDGNSTAYQHISDGDFATVTSWYVTNDLDKDSLSVRWTWADSDVSYLSQPADSLNLAFEDNQYVKLTYTVYDSITVAGGSVAMTVGGFCSTSTISTTAGDHTYYITANSTASSDSVYFKVNPDANVTAGKFAIDDISITSYNESPLTIADGSDVTLTIPNGAVELIVDPQGTDIKIEKYSNYYQINTAHPIPVSGVNSIKIANDSGSSATVYFYFNGI